jgi:hypothetical protein
VVLHLHNYRLVCAVGHLLHARAGLHALPRRNTAPGRAAQLPRHGPEAAVYAASLALWQRRLARDADVVVVPSAFARDGCSRSARRSATTCASSRTSCATSPTHRGSTPPAPRWWRRGWRPEKGVDTAIEACRLAGVPLTVAGDGPLEARLRAQAAGATSASWGRVTPAELDRLRAARSVAVVPSRSAETFGLAAAEAMAAGLPVAATDMGALRELVPAGQLAPAGDEGALAQVIARVRADQATAEHGLARVREVASPDVVAPLLAAAYDGQAAVVPSRP